MKKLKRRIGTQSVKSVAEIFKDGEWIKCTDPKVLQEDIDEHLDTQGKGLNRSCNLGKWCKHGTFRGGACRFVNHHKSVPWESMHRPNIKVDYGTNCMTVYCYDYDGPEEVDSMGSPYGELKKELDRQTKKILTKVQ